MKEKEREELMESLERTGPNGEDLCCMRCRFNSFTRMLGDKFICQHGRHKNEVHSYDDYCDDFKQYFPPERRW